ncbi:MAG: DNA gyrase subunit A [Desulfovibrionaceae bacterium]|nr:DNA gyrase subunit A [Desulfovibrionaceae bacterium]
MSEQHITIEEELKKSYLEYSLSVIVGRAIPDARDGLKPVHRRILFAQHELNNTYRNPHKKSARIVGDVIGKYHPHGDSAVYDALVRMAQDFSMRDVLIDGQGNFGSIDGDSAAAMRYTEARMTRLTSEFLQDIDKETVQFRPNYDNTLMEPAVLPTKVPNLLLNGTSGIAVGMATNIPPHNLGELCDALLYMVENPFCEPRDLLEFIKGPDFPTYGFIYAGKGLIDAYLTGRGSVKVRGKVEIEERKKDFQSLVITQIPYALNKASLVEKIALLVHEKKIEGITDLRDESSQRNGIRVVMDLKRGTIPEIVINLLYKHTPLETSFGINMMAVYNNKPCLLSLKEALQIFIEHRKDVIIKRTIYDLRQAQARAHIIEGLLIALDHIDAVIACIKTSKNTEEAKQRLQTEFTLSAIQAQAILDMRLQRLTNLGYNELRDEYRELQERIAYFQSILQDSNILLGVIKEELEDIKARFATPRRTEVLYTELDALETEDLIPDEDVVITLSKRGYIKRTPLSTYQQQRRGGKGIAGLNTSEDDFVQDFITTTTHQYLLLFTNTGRMLQLKVHQVPEGSRTAKGTHIANLLTLADNEFIRTILTIREFDENTYFLFATKRGMVKRSSASLYSRCRKSGIQAVGLRDGDELIRVCTVTNEHHIILTTRKGYAIRFDCNPDDLRPLGRSASGVRGIRLRGDDVVVSCDVVLASDTEAEMFTLSENGYGKRTKLELYRLQGRAGKGIITFKVTPKTGDVMGSAVVGDSNSLVLLTSTNKILRTGIDSIRIISRNTQGVRIVSLPANAVVVGFDLVYNEDIPQDEHGEDEDIPPLLDTFQ